MSEEEEDGDYANFIDWRDSSPRVVNHRFFDGQIHLFVKNGGWVSVAETPEDVQRRYWLARDAFRRVKVWPRRITEIREILLTDASGQRALRYIVSENVNGEDVIGFRSRGEAWSMHDFRLAIDFMHKHTEWQENPQGFNAGNSTQNVRGDCLWNQKLHEIVRSFNIAVSHGHTLGQNGRVWRCPNLPSRHRAAYDRRIRPPKSPV
jgi:hypothetical protein